MMDFKNGKYLNLKPLKTFEDEKIIGPMLIDGEVFIKEFQTSRDFVVFTNKRIFVVDVQGLTGKQKDISVLPYCKMQAFAIDTHGVWDMDSSLDIVFAGMGMVHLEFSRGTDMLEICKCLSKYVL